MLRDDVLMDWVKTLDVTRKWRWLDIGAGTGKVSKRIHEVLTSGSYTCYDVHPRGDGVRVFDGRKIPERFTVDFILFNFVLHHAGGNAQHLLRDAFALADTIVVQEDVPDGTREVARALSAHDPRGLFLAPEHWQEWFESLSPGCRVTTVPHPSQPDDLEEDYCVPRVLMIVEQGPAQ